MSDFFRKYWFTGLIGTILLLGVFLRTWHFSDWLHFELDQSRDAKVIDLAIQEGPDNLPLLGPRAGGSFLRLGPMFYYFEYLSAVIFGNTPPGIAVFNLIFSILTLPIFYLLARRYFDRKISIALLFLFSVSLFMVMYSRFAWNPNNVPFFSFLAFYAMLRAVDTNEKRPGVWLIVTAAALAIATHLHFLAFIIMPLVLLVFLLYKRPKIKVRYWLASLLIIFIFYIPPIINDIKTGGANIKEFSKVVTKKSDKSDHSFPEKIIRSYVENSLGSFLLATSHQNYAFPKIYLQNNSFTWKCDKKCTKDVPFGIVAVFFFTTGVALLLLNLKKLWGSGDETKKDFIILSVLWLGASFAVFTPLAYDIAPRFFLLTAALPFFFIGFILEFAEKIVLNKKIYFAIFAIAILTFAASSALASKKRFSEMKIAPYENFEGNKIDKFINEHTRVTLEQQNMIVEYMAETSKANSYPVFLNTEPFYARALFFGLKNQDVLADGFKSKDKKIFRNGNYFLVYSTSSNIDLEIENYTAKYDVLEKRPFGTLTAIRIIPKEAAITETEKKIKPEDIVDPSGIPARYRWEEIFGETAEEESLIN